MCSAWKNSHSTQSVGCMALQPAALQYRRDMFSSCLPTSSGFHAASVVFALRFNAGSAQKEAMLVETKQIGFYNAKTSLTEQTGLE